MQNINHKIGGFATPFESAFFNAAGVLALQQFKFIVKDMIGVLEKQGWPEQRMARIVYDNLNSARPDVIYFCPEIGVILLALLSRRRSNIDPEWMCGQTAVAAYLCGLLPSLDLRLSTCLPIVAAGFHVGSSTIRIDGNQERLKFADGSGRCILELRKWCSPGVNPVWVDAKGRSLPLMLGSAGAAILAGHHPSWEMSVESKQAQEVADEPLIWSEHIERTLSLLERATPEYYLWVACMLKHLIPIKRVSESAIGSASNALLPGVVQITVPATLAETADMLVHECSHQYFNLVLRFVHMQNADANQHYSPLTHTERPVDRLLIGYHAFVNVLLMYRRLSEFPEAEVSVGRIAKTQTDVDELEATLDRVAGEELTADGQCIFSTARSRLRTE